MKNLAKQVANQLDGAKVKRNCVTYGGVTFALYDDGHYWINYGEVWGKVRSEDPKYIAQKMKRWERRYAAA